MPKLTNTQLVILSAAAERHGGTVLPLPKSLKLNKTAVARSIKSLIARELVAEQPGERDEEAWREADNDDRLKLVISEAGLAAIGADADNGYGKRPAAAMARSKKRKSPSRGVASGRPAGTEASPPSVREGMKQVLLIDLLKRERGATIAEIVEATGWQPHSVRGAISGTLKKKLRLTVESEVVEDRGRVYRIVGRQNGA